MVLSSLSLLLLACSCTGALASVQEAPSCAATVQALPLAPGLDPADPRLSGPALVVVEKGARRVAVYQGGALAAGACWPVGLAAGAPAGPKRRRLARPASAEAEVDQGGLGFIAKAPRGP